MDTFALSNVLATWNSAKALVNTAAQMTSNLAREMYCVFRMALREI